MGVLVDTDICSVHLRGVREVSGRFLQHTGQLFLSVLSLGELLSWTLRAKSSPRYQHGLERFLAEVSLLSVDQAVAIKFGEVRADLLDHGRPLPTVDLLIAATALVHGLTLVTHNTRHFGGIPGLNVVDWLST